LRFSLFILIFLLYAHGMKLIAGCLIHSIHGPIAGHEIHYSNVGRSLVLRKINPHVRRLKAGEPETNPCIQWTYADAIWQSFTSEQKAEWQAAIKAPGVSNYDIWMKEALWHCQQYEYLPDHPSASGGYSHGPLNPGFTFPPTPDKEPPEPPPPPPPPPPIEPESGKWYCCYEEFWDDYEGECDGDPDSDAVNCYDGDYCIWLIETYGAQGECWFINWMIHKYEIFTITGGPFEELDECLSNCEGAPPP